MADDPRSGRQAALRAAIAAEGLDALLVTHLPNIRYLTGFSGSAGLLLVTRDEAVLITDFRYAAQAPAEAAAAAAVEIEPANVWDRLRRVVEGRRPETLGIEAQALTVRDAERVASLGSFRVAPVSDTVERLRTAKDPGEVAAIRAAAALASEALDEVLPGVRAGETERGVAARLEAALRRRGSEWHPFPTIVASGPRSALPHARSTDRPVGRGEWLLLDFGAQVDGYCADLTRTVVVGGAPDLRQREVYGVVREAQARAAECLRPGMSGREADALARDVIAQAGYGDAFGHSLGHGLGLEVHEAPRLSPTATGPVPAHSVVTIEPGIYLEDWGGVRLEDDVYLAPDGPVALSDGRTELITTG